MISVRLHLEEEFILCMWNVFFVFLRQMRRLGLVFILEIKAYVLIKKKLWECGFIDLICYRLLICVFVDILSDFF